ncbi:MAG: hypothetical protein H0W83_00530 [Planctomycetes bacterium]|nr:hypothetical protein [Planctomycetota bacterium]
MADHARYLGLALAVLAIASCGDRPLQAQAASEEATPEAPAERRDDGAGASYRIGDRTVRLRVALDRVHIDCDHSQDADALSRSGFAAEPTPTAGRFVVRFSAVAGRTALEQRAREVASATGASAVFAVAYDPEAAEPAELVITHRLSVIADAAVDIPALAAKAGLAVVERSAAAANAMILLDAEGRMLGAIDAANRVAVMDGVVSATPLIERPGTLRRSLR